MNSHASDHPTKRPARWRKATHDDTECVVSLVNSAYRGESGKRGWTTESDLLGGQRVDKEQIKELLESEQSYLLLACDDREEILGCVHVKKVGADAYFGMLTVGVDSQARGLGSFLLETAETFAREALKAEKMEMTVIASRKELIAWYERRGYVVRGETRPFPYGNPRFGLPLRDDLYFEVFDKRL